MSAGWKRKEFGGKSLALLPRSSETQAECHYRCCFLGATAGDDEVDDTQRQKEMRELRRRRWHSPVGERREIRLVPASVLGGQNGTTGQAQQQDRGDMHCD